MKKPMGEFKDEVRRLRKEVLRLSQDDLASQVGMTQGWVSHIETGEIGIPGSDVMVRLCNALKVPPDYFAEFISPDTVALPRGIPVLGVIGAGPAIDDPAEPGEMLDVSKLYPAGCGAYKVRGDSMEDAAILDGDYLVLRKDPDPKNGEQVIAWIAEDQGHVAKTLRIRGKKSYLESAGYKYTLKENDKVLGVIEGVIRGKRK